jgi:hypothetical protein
MRWFHRVIVAVTLTAAVLPMALLAQTADYNNAVAKAKADLSAGLYDAALYESNDAIQLDASRWKAYLVAGGALQNKKPFDERAVAYYTKALERAPEAKKAAVKDLLEQCKKLSGAPKPAVSAPATTARSPTFIETFDWIRSKNDEEGYSFSATTTTTYTAANGYTKTSEDTSKETHHVPLRPFGGGQPISDAAEGIQCAAVLGTERYVKVEGGPTYNYVVNFAASVPNSVGVKPVDVHKVGAEGTETHVTQNGSSSILGATSTSTYVTKVTTNHDTVYQITGLRDMYHPTIELAGPTYSDQNLANRVAKALNHAIDVCGGKGKPEAF